MKNNKIKCEMCGYSSFEESHFRPDDADRILCNNCYRESRHTYLNTVLTGEF